MSHPTETGPTTPAELSARSTKSPWPQATRLAATTALLTFLFTFILAGSWWQTPTAETSSQGINALEDLASALTRTAEVAGSSVNAVAVTTLLVVVSLVGLIAVVALIATASKLISRARSKTSATGSDLEYVIGWARTVGSMSQRLLSLYVAVLVSTALVAHNAGLPIALLTSTSASDVIPAAIVLLATSFPVQVTSRFAKVFGPQFRKFNDRFDAMGLRRNILRSGTK